MEMGLLGVYYSEYYEYCRANFRGNNGIYDWADTENKLTWLHKYMRLRTSETFKRLTAGAGKPLSVSKSKTATLVKLGSGIDDWEYGGCEDLGYLGAGHCTLGHALRYAHYATSRSTGQSLVFGISCASDFFEISEHVLKQLKKTQEDLIEELKIIPYLLGTGRADWWRNKYYSDFEDSINEFGSDFARKALGVYCEPMVYFYKLGIPFTTYMVGIWNSARSRSYEPARLAKTRSEAAKAVAQNDKFAQEILEKLSGYENLHYVKTAIALYTSRKITGIEMQKTLKNASGICDVADLVQEWSKGLDGQANYYQDRLKKCLSRSRESVLAFMQSNFDKSKYVHEDKKTKKKEYETPELNVQGLRLATSLEASRVASKKLTEAINYPVGRSASQAIALLTWCICGQQYQYDMGPCGYGEKPEEYKMEESLAAVEISIQWAKKGKLVEALNKLVYLPYSVYLSTADDEDTSGVDGIDVGYMINWIYNSEPELEHVPKDIEHAVKTALNIAKRCYNVVNPRLSPRQLFALRRGYDKARKHLDGDLGPESEDNQSQEERHEDSLIDQMESWGQQAVPETTPNELLEKARLCHQYGGRIHLRKYEFHKSVCKTVNDKGRCSDKQKKYVEEFYDFLVTDVSELKALESRPRTTVEKGTEQSGNGAPAMPGVSRQASSGQQSKVVGVGDDIEYKDEFEGIEEYEDRGYETEEPKETPVGTSRNGIPTVAEMSQALGKGLFEGGES